MSLWYGPCGKDTTGVNFVEQLFDKIVDGGSGEKARLAWLARTILVVYVEPKRFFWFF
jgi:hypothetical protein